MKKIILIGLAAFFSLLSAFAQEDKVRVGYIVYGSAESRGVNEGGRYLKKIENAHAEGMMIQFPDGRESHAPNVRGKQGLDRRFFGDFNAKVEYFFDPSFSPAQGLRIYRDSLDRSYLLEVKTIANYKEVNHQVQTEFPTRGAKTLAELEGEQGEQMRQHNRKMWGLQRVEKLKRYQIDSTAIPLSDSLAEWIYKKTVETIETFTQIKPPPLMYDGYQATFRAVVDFELWTFTIHEPRGRVEELSNLFREIIVDVQADCFDETKYLNRLGD